ncbi:MAG: DUF721 domain-containing protein [Akkermansia sp.]
MGKDEHKPQDEASPIPAAKKRYPRMRYQRYADGSVRPVRAQSFAKGESDQALADFYGAAPELPVGSNMKSIEALISEITAKLQIVEESIAPEILATAWQEAMGEYIATQARLISINNELATIQCLHPALRFELNKRRRHIISLLNKRFGDQTVKRIRLLHG